MFPCSSGNKSCICPQFIKLDPCAVSSLLHVLKSSNFGCRIFISFHVGMLMMFDSAPESTRKINFKVCCLKIFAFWAF